MLTLIAQIGTEFGISVIVCSHLLGEVERICDALVAIDGGRLLRADRIDAMTTRRDVLAVEVDEGTEVLADGSPALGLQVTPDGRALVGAAGVGRHVRPDHARGRRPRTAAAPPRPDGATTWPNCSRPPADGGRQCEAVDTRTGVIHDIGYQRYTGPRLGRGYAVRSLYVHGLRSAFGLGRSAKAKIFPWLVIGILFFIAVDLAW